MMNRYAYASVLLAYLVVPLLIRPYTWSRACKHHA